MVAKITLFLFLSVPIGIARAERVQSPDARWKTIKTPHYRIHYPANPKGGFEAFAMEVASKIERVHDVVVEWVGYEVKGPTDVVIQDPIMEANAAVDPQLKNPVILLYTTPPEPDSQIDHYHDHIDMLLTHELAHLHHTGRPYDRWSDGFLLRYGPITSRVPRFIIEGYATMLEGVITGAGRPRGAYRSAVIRQWALEGKLPDYDAASRGGGFRGGSMAYLLGSAYLEWLETQNAEEPGILKNFWKQLASKADTDTVTAYADSFKAVFGIAPKDSYDRWRAEITHDAIALEQSAKANNSIREGALVARFDGEITDLAVSPDGTKLMARVLAAPNPGIRIWDLSAPPDTGKKSASQQKTPEFTEPKLIKTIQRRNGILPSRAWWTDNNQVAFELREPDGEGILKPSFWVADLETGRIKPAAAPPAKTENNDFIRKEIGGVWNIVRKLPDGGEQQITSTLSAAWQPAPAPDGKALYYVRLTATGCEIRRIDLTQPIPEFTPLQIAGNTLTQGAILSLPDTAGYLPQPDAAAFKAEDYSVWDSHSTGARAGFFIGPSSNSMQFGWGGSDVLNRLNWYAVAAFPVIPDGNIARGPMGARFGAAYRGWRFAPSFQAFSSLEKPSHQKIAPVYGLDRNRIGAELAFTWRHQGMSPVYFRPFASWESINTVGAAGRADNIDTIDDADNADRADSGMSDANRFLAGTMVGFDFKRSRGNWGIDITSAFQGAVGSTKPDTGFDTEEGGGKSWNLVRFKARLDIKTPVIDGRLLPGRGVRFLAEEGRLQGNYTALDAFRLGGQTSLVPPGLEFNRVSQPALPDYYQAGDRMRALRIDRDIVLGIRFYYEWATAWQSGVGSADYQRVWGFELSTEDIVSRSTGVPTVNIGIHRPLDGPMKGKTVFTANLSFRF